MKERTLVLDKTKKWIGSQGDITLTIISSIVLLVIIVPLYRFAYLPWTEAKREATIEEREESRRLEIAALIRAQEEEAERLRAAREAEMDAAEKAFLLNQRLEKEARERAEERKAEFMDSFNPSFIPFGTNLIFENDSPSANVELETHSLNDVQWRYPVRFK